MAKLTKKAANDLLEGGFITETQFDKMFDEGVVSSSSRATRPQINVPNEHKSEFTDKAYEALENLAKDMEFDYTKPTPDGGLATLYIKGSGSPRNTDEETEDEGFEE